MSLPHILQTQIVRELDGFIREIDAFPDDVSVWNVVPGVTNSAGNLALHVAGNLQHFIGSVLTQSGYVRNRDLEFSQRGVPRADVVAELQRARAAVIDAFAQITPAQYDADYPQPMSGHTVNTAQFLSHLAAHIAFHLGQAGYLRRIVTGANTSAGPLPIAAIARS